MPIEIPDGFALCSVEFNPQTGLPNGAAFTFGVGLAVVPGQGIADELVSVLTASGIHNAWATTIVPARVRVKCGPNDTGPFFVASYTEAGGETGAVGAASPSILITKQTLLGGKRGRGRMFIPGQSESAIDPGGVVGATTRADVQTRANNLRTGIIAATSMTMMVLLHGPATEWALVNGKPRRVTDPDAPAPPVPTEVTSMVVESTVATQRRRQRA